MIIQHNLPALGAYNKLVTGTSAVSKASEKLATGYRINRAADDAAGLAVSEKLRTQLRGITQAQRNCQDGINLIGTFEGALSQSHSVLQRCKELAAEAANGNYDDPTDRAAIELEFEQLQKEINNISDTDYNGLLMLNGGTLASAEPSATMGWLNPIGMEWKKGSFVNETNDKNFKMTLSPTPAFKELTFISKEEYDALDALNNSQIGLNINNGLCEYEFTSRPTPRNVTIETRGATGYICLNTAGGVTEIATVTASGVNFVLNNTSKGNWSSRNGSISMTGVPQKFNSTNLPSNRDAGDVYKTARQNYDTWIMNYPNIVCRVSDDRQSFTVSTGGSSVKGFSEGTYYPKGSEITIVSAPDNTESKLTVNWDASTIKPGTTISYNHNNYQGGGTAANLNNNRYGPDGRLIYHLVNFATITADFKRSNFLAHGRERFTVRYNENATGEKWTLTVTNYDTGRPGSSTKTTKSEIEAYLNTYGITGALDSFEKAINEIHDNDNEVASDIKLPNKEPNGYVKIADKGLYSFTLGVDVPGFSSREGTAWHPTDANALTLGKYNPANPEKGGIDYEVATPGNVYTYRNDDVCESEDSPGYWVDQNGHVVDMEAEGIYIPVPEQRKNGSLDILHDGFSITIGKRITGPTGKASAVVRLWDDGETPFTPFLDNGIGSMTYAEDLTLQVNSRTKDAVNLTFNYHSDAVGDIECNLNCSAEGLGLTKLSLATQSTANIAIDQLDHAIAKISMIRACFGTANNRLEHKVENLTVSRENLTNSESQIRDTDMATEMMNFTKSQIIQQAAQSMLAQAMQNPQGALSLLS